MRTRMSFVVVLALAACATLTQPDAKVIDFDNKVEAVSDAVLFVLQEKLITPDEAEIVHGALTVAKGHNDRMRKLLLEVKSEGRLPTELELQRAKGLYQLALDALRVARERLTAYKARKNK